MESEDTNKSLDEQSDKKLARQAKKSTDDLSANLETEGSSSQNKAEMMMMRVRESRSMFVGPMPPPEYLKAYDLVQPGLAKDIVDLTKKQSQHRMEMEKIVIAGDDRRSWTGLILGFILACICISSSTYLILKGHDLAGGALVGTTLASLVGSFIYGTNKRSEERVEKQKALLEARLDEHAGD